jgi:hypothetical protein
MSAPAAAKEGNEMGEREREKERAVHGGPSRRAAVFVVGWFPDHPHSREPRADTHMFYFVAIVSPIFVRHIKRPAPTRAHKKKKEGQTAKQQ